MSIECPSGLAPFQKLTSYVLQREEFDSIFGGGNATVVTDFYFFGGLTSITINLPQGFCNIDLGDYEDISNLEILLALLTFPNAILTLLQGTLVYLKINRNVERYLQATRACACKKETVTEPNPSPSPIPTPNPNDPPPDTCCTDCFETRFNAVQELNIIHLANQAAFEAEFPQLERITTTTPPSPPYNWITLGCSPVGFPCQTADYLAEGGSYLDPLTGNFYQNAQGGSVQWHTGVKLLYREFCDEEDPPALPSPPTPEPLPPDQFDFCEAFPALCNACPDTGNAQDVVVSGKINSTCSLKEDVSFNLKF